jgi:Zn-dependent peptidase ImmA (M78 family)
MKGEININVDMITWAIARAGYDLHEFISQFPKIQDWIENKKTPTLKQLEKFSHKVHIPFGYLFLANPPKEELPIPFFRTEKTGETSVSLNVFDTILLIQRRQNWLKDYLIENDFEPKEFVGKFNVNSAVTEIVADIRNTLGLEENWAQNFATWEKALNYLTEVIEESGIYIIFNSVVENNTSRPIKVDECRGFILVDEMCPFMFINSADGKAAQLFTIIHELAHIWTGESAGFDFRQLQPASEPIEILCDKVAAEFLVPEDYFIKYWEKNPNIKAIARYFKVSPIVIARRALDLGKLSKAAFFAFYNDYISQLEFKKKNQSGGGDFYATAKKRISLSFAAHVNHAVKTNNLLYRDAFKLTGLKGDTYHKFLTKHL